VCVAINREREKKVEGNVVESSGSSGGERNNVKVKKIEEKNSNCGE
jgi:hypothetical protein